VANKAASENGAEALRYTATEISPAASIYKWTTEPCPDCTWGSLPKMQLLFFT